jgi:hypothetical protein
VALFTHERKGKLSRFRHKATVSALDLPPSEITRRSIRNLCIAFAVYTIFWVIGRSWMVMDFDELWKPEASVFEAMGKVWFLFAWAIGVTLAVGILQVHHGIRREHEPGETFWKGLWISLHAGVFEELIFRWMVFFIAMVSIRFLNAITYGFVGWWYTEVLVPLANWSTMGALQPQLIDSPTWLLGAALVSASITFRDAHKHLGLLGLVNAWFGGMVLFYVMFHYGLWAAIVVHVAYDICVFTTRAFVNSRLKPQVSLGWLFSNLLR